jgi:hypothetical protein
MEMVVVLQKVAGVFDCCMWLAVSHRGICPHRDPPARAADRDSHTRTSRTDLPFAPADTAQMCRTDATTRHRNAGKLLFAGQRDAYIQPSVRIGLLLLFLVSHAV